MRIIFNIVLVLALIAGGVYLKERYSQNTQTNSLTSNQVTVAASIYPIAELVRAIGGTAVTVTQVVPSGSEPHDYEPNLQTITGLNEAKLLVYVDNAFEPWMKNFAEQNAINQLQLSSTLSPELLQEHTPHGDEDNHANEKPAAPTAENKIKEIDPHLWLNPKFLLTFTTAIRDSLIRVDPTNTELYQSGAEATLNKLSTLDEAYKTGLANCKQNTLIGNHSAFQYVAEAYNLNFLSISGPDPEIAPTFADLQTIIKTIQQKNIGIIFSERVNPLPQSVQVVTEAATVPVRHLQTMEQTPEKNGATMSLFETLESNLAELQAGLQCSAPVVQ